MKRTDGCKSIVIYDDMYRFTLIVLQMLIFDLNCAI